MKPLYAFTVIMLIWTVADLVSKKTKSLVSSLLVASIIFLVGFKTNILPEDLLVNSSLLALGSTIIGFIIIHIGSMLSVKELKNQWKTVVVGVSATFGIVVFLIIGSPLLGGLNMAIAGAAGVTGGTISVILVQDVALPLGLTSVAVLPVLISAFQGIIGFPITSIILKKEAQRIKNENDYQAIRTEDVIEKESKLPKGLQSTSGTLLVVGLTMMVASLISRLTGGIVNEFVIALVMGVVLRELGVFKKNILEGIDAYGLMMLAIMIIVFAPLATVSIEDLLLLLKPLLMSFAIGLSGGAIFAIGAGKAVGYSPMMSLAIGLTSLFGFPGTMILSKEAAASVGENEEEVLKIEGEIMPKMIIAGFSTVTITSVIIIGFMVNFIA